MADITCREKISSGDTNKSIIKFWDTYRFMTDEWTLFYNGYDYAPIIVSFGLKNEFDIINIQMQNKFNTILKLAKDKIHDI